MTTWTPYGGSLARGAAPGPVRAAPGTGATTTLRGLSLLVRTGTVVSGVLLCLVGASVAGATDLRRVALAGVCVGAGVAFGQVVNDLADVVADRLDQPHRPLVAGTVRRVDAVGVAVATAVTALAAGAALGAPALVAVAGVLAVAWAYSHGLKGTVVLGNAAVAALCGGTVGFGAAVTTGHLGGRALAATAAVTAFMLLFEVVKTARDATGDRAVGLRTVATCWGPRRTGLLVAVLAGVFAAFAAAPLLTPGPWRAYAAVMAVGGVLPTAAAAVVVLRHGATPDGVRPALRLLRVAWVLGTASLVLL